MTLRLKLILGFITISLTVVGAFSVVAYTSARDYTQHIEIAHLKKNNTNLLSRLDKSDSVLVQLQNIVKLHESSYNSYSIIDRQTNKILKGGSFTFGNQLLTELAKQNSNLSKRQSGHFTLGEQEYLWVVDPVYDSRFSIANVYRRDTSDIATFISYIGTPLGITLFFSVWISLWTSAILANLFQKIADSNNQLEHQSTHDSLTQLPNRASIGKIVLQQAAEAKESNTQLLFCLIDIDALKEINDSLGYESGDILLNQVTQRLRHTLRPTDHLGRYGGNKFSVMIRCTDLNNIESSSQKILENFDPVFEINGHSLYVRATLGIAIFPDHATGAQELIQKTETALHKARKMAVDFSVYDISQDNNSAERLRMTHDLRNAIQNEELQLHYQPQFNVKHKVVNSVEALARWIHPQHGFIPPDVFIEIAEQTGLIQPLTDWVLRTAIKQCAEWRDMNKNITVSVNLSARNLHDETLGQQISNLLNYWNVSAEKLCLEITETAMMTDPDHARTLLKVLDNLGVRLSIDDFGTGYSSLGYLKNLPVDELKVDKSFVLNMAKDENDAAIVQATVSLAHDLGLEVVAEGVEDQASQDALSQMGCEYIQGYHIARPMPHDELTAILISAEASNDEQVTTIASNIHPGSH